MGYSCCGDLCFPRANLPRLYNALEKAKTRWRVCVHKKRILSCHWGREGEAVHVGRAGTKTQVFTVTAWLTHTHSWCIHFTGLLVNFPISKRVCSTQWLYEGAIGLPVACRFAARSRKAFLYQIMKFAHKSEDEVTSSARRMTLTIRVFSRSNVFQRNLPTGNTWNVKFVRPSSGRD